MHLSLQLARDAMVHRCQNGNYFRLPISGLDTTM
jgi:hypothetical protein